MSYKQPKRPNHAWIYVIIALPIFCWAFYLFPRMVILWFDPSILSDLEQIPIYQYCLWLALIATACASFIFLSVFLFKRQQAKRKQNLLIKTGVAQIETLTPFEFESWVAHVLELLGYHADTTKKSGDYGADVIAEKAGIRIAIQVKKYQQAVGIQAVQEVISAVGYYHCQAGWVITSADSFTTAARNLAQIHHIRLITKNDLVMMLSQIQQA